MKQFILKLVGFSFFVGFSILLVFFQADGSTDAFYVKFTTPKQSSLIIGSSRAAQDLIPDVISEELQIEAPYNYAFSIAHTAYGEAYYRSIEKKLNYNSSDGLFILCVNPWTISSMTKDPDDASQFREQNSFIANTHFVNINPNVEYLLESFKARNIDIFLNKNRKGEYQTYSVNDNGWLKVIIESDMILTSERTKNKVANYKKKLSLYHGVSQTRLNYLSKTITLLQQYGTVYLVRLPTNNDMFIIEEQLDPDFNKRMLSIAKLHSIDYINTMLIRDSFSYTDGHHLDIKSAKQFSKYIAKTIKNLQKNPSKF